LPTFVPRGAGRPVRRWKAARFRIFYVYLDPLMGPLRHPSQVIEKGNEFWKVRASTTTCGPRLGFHGVASRQPPAHSLLSRRIGPGSRSPKNRGAHFVAAGQPCTGARILGLPSTPPGITRRRGGAQPPPCCSHSRRCAPADGHNRLRGDGRSSPCHGNEAGASRLCAGRVNFLKNCFPD